MSLDKYLVEHCSPTLASLKTANMFSCRYESERALENAINTWNELFTDKGVELIVLKKENGLALIYVCRRKMLEADLNKKGVTEFLKAYGYRSTDTEYAIRKLKSRLKAQQDFPHEIGLFLGYPVEDVKGFIKYKGECSKCIGCWKVYGDVMKAEDTFNRYKKCTNDYVARFRQGTPLEQLTVCA